MYRIMQTASFSFVIPTYNRRQNLSLLLHALCLQTDQDFEVVISDDGSTDGTGQMLLQYRNRLRMRYCWQRHDGYRVGLARNEGTRIANPTSTHIWFVDSDILLNKHSVKYARDLCTRELDAIICGRYDWLPPMKITHGDIVNRWRMLTTGRLQRISVDYPHETAVRPDHRSHVENYAGTLFDNKTRRRSRGTLSGNLIVPKIWLKRGFDDTIHGQGQDGEFGHHIYGIGAECIFCDEIVGYHMAHSLDSAWKATSVQRTIRYINKKYRSKEPAEW